MMLPVAVGFGTLALEKPQSARRIGKACLKRFKGASTQYHDKVAMAIVTVLIKINVTGPGT